MRKARKLIEWVGSALDHVTRVLRLISGAMIVLMAFVVGYGVVMRYVFRTPTPYPYEITCILMLGCVVFSIAYTQRLGEHVRMDIMDRYFPKAVKEILINIVGPIIGLGFCIPVVWKSINQAQFALQTGQVTTAVGLPAFAVKVTIPIGVGLLCLVLIAQILRYCASRIAKKTEQRDAD